VAVIALPVLILALIGEPTQRGFFCDDESLRFPYQKSIVTDWMLYIYGFVVPLVFVVMVETLGKSQLLPVEASLGYGRTLLPALGNN